MDGCGLFHANRAAIGDCERFCTVPDGKQGTPAASASQIVLGTTKCGDAAADRPSSGLRRQICHDPSVSDGQVPAVDGTAHRDRTGIQAEVRWLELAHAPAYVEQVLACSVPARIEREIGFPVSERVSRRAQLASAGTVLAARLSLAHGIACNAAGGSHHARHAQGAGFCTFNDVGVAASLLLAEGVVGRILVVDLDVHQGDGTADIFADEPRVFTFSMHGERNYPIRKIASDLDIGLPDGTDDAAYLATLRQSLPVVAKRAAPDLVFYNAG